MQGVLYLALIGGGVVIGLLVGRWWALAAAIGVGAWITAVTDVDEVSGWVLGAAYGLLAGCGVTLGVVVRQWKRGSG